jgi:hypothetical protein
VRRAFYIAANSNWMELKMTKAAKLSKPEAIDDDVFSDMYGSNWFGPDDVRKMFTTLIESWERVTFAGIGGKAERDKIVLTLKGVKKPVPLNKTNALNLASAWGKNPNNWVGKRVRVQVELTSYAGKPTKGLRLYPVDPNDMNDSINF